MDEPTVFEGSDVVVYQAIVLKHALRLYKNTGLRPNSQWTPSNMMSAAKDITKKEFKPRDYDSAIKALDEWITQQTPEAKDEGQ